MTALTVAEIVDRLAATRDPNRPPYIPPTPTREDRDMQERAMSCGTWDWAGSEWFLADLKGGRR